MPGMNFRFEDTRHKLGVRISGQRNDFHEFYGMLNECWDCTMPDADDCSYKGVLTYFAYEVRHTFMGQRLTKLDGIPVKNWDDKVFKLFEEESERFEVGMEISWPQMLMICASWWECLRHKYIPSRIVAVMRYFTDSLDTLLQQRSRIQYAAIEPYLHGAVYAANPYLMLTMEYINVNYLKWAKYGPVSMKNLADMMDFARFGTYRYDSYLSRLKRQAKKLGCAVENLSLDVDDSVYDIEL